ncbi:hypothetical protein [Nocardia arthritidis]|uniref:Uncharacterized protein n=1 Tax=Nocardia arthritidis TaxID=228602 RepID=A0A6G9Y7A0_9NOCA|nr:hypothetical protein [Nocardia arthritidis]QIS08990.1 hypothetical protein F5544_05390 [Nocardia arthritidis]
MNIPSTPTRVSLYCSAKDLVPHKVAEFDWDPATGVSLTVLDTEWARLAEEYYVNGIRSLAEQQLVRPDEPEVFMRALVQPSRLTYYQFVDESANPSGE